MKSEKRIIRVLDERDDKALIVPCTEKSMPRWVDNSELLSYSCCSEEELLQETRMGLSKIDTLDAQSRKFVYEHYTMIAGVLPFISDERERCYAIARISEET